MMMMIIVVAIIMIVMIIDHNNGLVQTHKLFSSNVNCFIESIYGNSIGKFKYYLY